MKAYFTYGVGLNFKNYLTANMQKSSRNLEYSSSRRQSIFVRNKNKVISEQEM